MNIYIFTQQFGGSRKMYKKVILGTSRKDSFFLTLCFYQYFLDGSFES